MMRYRFGPFLFLFSLVSALCAFPMFESAEESTVKQARTELLAARYDNAIELYRKILAQEPAADGYYGLTRALLKSHRSKEAYAAADESLKRVPQTAAAQTAAGLAMFRKGDIPQAESFFRAAIKLDANYCGALSGLASIYSSVSKPKTARDLLHQAYATCPDDPTLMLARANTFKGAEHINALERVLAAIDPESEEARGVQAHIASDRALGDRKTRRMISAYVPARIKLTHVMNGPNHLRGFGVRVQFNQRYTATLLLDTGASGISLAPKAAQKAGLELLSDESMGAKGIGDKKPEDSFTYLAPEIRIGPLVFADHPVSVFRTAKDSDIDGLIGSDVFQKFVVSLDFPGLQLALEPYPALADDDSQDSNAIPEGFHRVIRAGNHLLIATSVNQSPAKLFLIDSGSSSNLIDAEGAREFTGVHRDGSTGVRGIQGNVDRVSRADRITLNFAGFRQDNPDLIAISLEKPSESMGVGITGVLGMPVLAQLKLTIDYRAGAVRLERPK